MARNTALPAPDTRAITGPVQVSGGTPAEAYAARTMEKLRAEAERYRRELQPFFNDEATQQAQQDVDEGTAERKNPRKLAAQAYDQAAEIALTARAEQDARDRANELFRESEGDIESFELEYNAWSAEYLATLPSGLAFSAERAVNAAGRGVVEKLQADAFDNTRAEAVSALRTTQKRARDRVLAAMRDGDGEELTTAMESYVDATAVRARFWGETYSDTEAAVDLEDLQFDLAVTGAIPEVDERFESEGALGARLAIQGMVDATEGLTPAQATTMKSRLDERINNLLSITNAQAAEEERAYSRRQRAEAQMSDRASREFLTLYANNGEGLMDWLVDNQTRLSPEKYSQFIGMTERRNSGGEETADTRFKYAQLALGAGGREPTDVAMNAAEAFVAGELSRTEFDKISTIAEGARDDRIREAQRWVKAQFGVTEMGFSFTGADTDTAEAAEIAFRISQYGAANPEASTNEVMLYAFNEVAQTGKRGTLAASLPVMPGLDTKPQTREDLTVIQQWIGANLDTLSDDELLRLQFEYDRWSIYLTVPETE